MRNPWHELAVLALVVAGVVGTLWHNLGWLGTDAPCVDPPPDILIVIWDDFGAPRGFPASPSTPAIDGLAAQGVEFTRCYGAPTCQPGRYMIQTGHWWTADAGSGACAAPGSNTPTLSEKFIPERLPTYASALFGKWHLGGCRVPAWTWEGAPISQGFDYWLTGIPANIQNNCAGSPTHYSQYLEVEAGVGAVVQGYQPDRLRDRFVALYPSAPEPALTVVALNFPHAPFHQPPGSPFGCQFANFQYECMIEYQDARLGEMLDMLDGVDDDDLELGNTLVILCGDNGTPPQVAGNKSKETCYELGVRVPLIVAGAGIDAGLVGTTSNELVSVVDIHATAVLAGGGSVAGGPHPIVSRDLAPLFTGGTWTPREHVIAGHNWKTGLSSAVRCIVSEDGWKLIQKSTDAGDEPELEELYDLNTDPTELVNVLASNATRADAMRATLEAESLP